MPVHYLKKQAIFQLCNFLLPNSITRIKDLADGLVLQKVIQTKFSEFKNSVDSPDKLNCVEGKKDLNDDHDSFVKCNQEVTPKAQDITPVNQDGTLISQDGIPETQDETPKTQDETPKTQDETPETHGIPETVIPESNECAPARNEVILQRFHYIKDFINDRYCIKSEEIISYDKCIKTNELELTKVVLFVLCEIIKHLLEVDKEHLETLFHLENQYQEELKDCFNLFVSERERISKTEVEKLLSKCAAKDDSLYNTPRRTSSRYKELKSVSTSTPKEDVFTNSPLKSYFESPVFKKEDLFFKEREIQNLKKLLQDADQESMKLHCKLTEMQDKLKKKDKEFKELKKQMAAIQDENKALQNSCQSEICKEEKEKLHENEVKLQKEISFFRDQVVELHVRIAELEKNQNKELPHEKERNNSKLPLCSDKCIILMEEKNRQSDKEIFQNEIFALKNVIKTQELEIYTLKNQLSEILKEESRLINSPGNPNKSYEGLWNEYSCKRKEEGEEIVKFIEADNTLLRFELNKAHLENKELIEEIEALKEKITNKTKKTDQTRKVHSKATMTVMQTHEEEKLRNSENTEEQYHLFDVSNESLHNSRNVTVSEHSVITSEPEITTCPEIPSEAVLWRTYDYLKPDNISGIKPLDHDCGPEDTQLNCVNDLNDIDKIDSTFENNYINAFFKELKKLTKNGSYQKVLQVFIKKQKGINGTYTFNGSNFQELFNLALEYMCLASRLNAESSLTNFQDKCTYINEYDFHDTAPAIELNRLKEELQQSRIELKELKAELRRCKEEKKKYEEESEKNKELAEKYKKELERIKEEKNVLESKYKDCIEKLSCVSKSLEEYKRKLANAKENLDYKTKRCNDLEEQNTKLSDENLKQQNKYLLLKQRYKQISNWSVECDKRIRKIKEDRNKYYQRVKMFEDKESMLEEKERMFEEKQEQLEEKQKILEERMIMIEKKEKYISEISNKLEEKEKKLKKPEPTFPSRDSLSYFEIVRHLKSNLHSSSLQDTANESVLSGALFNKSNYQFAISEEEESYNNSKGLDFIKKDEDRAEELKRRNSLLPLHMQSAYPVEANLRTAYDKFYIKDNEINKNKFVHEKSKEENICKKRKLIDAVLPEEPPNSIIQTPVSKNLRRRTRTPLTIQRFKKSIQMRQKAK